MLDQQEFAARKVSPGLSQQDNDLHRKYEISVKVLVHAAVIPVSILQQQWRRTILSSAMAEIKIVGMFDRIPSADPHALVPGIGDRGEAPIERRAKLSDEVGKRLAEVPIFTLAECVARHDDATTEAIAFVVKRF